MNIVVSKPTKQVTIYYSTHINVFVEFGFSGFSIQFDFRQVVISNRAPAHQRPTTTTPTASNTINGICVAGLVCVATAWHGLSSFVI